MRYTGIGVGAEIHHLAKDAGLFKKNGLDVEIIYIPAGSTAIQAMLSGEVSVAWGQRSRRGGQRSCGGISPENDRRFGQQVRL